MTQGYDKLKNNSRTTELPSLIYLFYFLQFVWLGFICESLIKVFPCRFIDSNLAYQFLKNKDPIP